MLLGEPARDRRCRSARCRRTPRPRGSRACASERWPSVSLQLLQHRVVGLRARRPPPRSAKFLAAARIIVGPPMSMFSITSCSVDAAAGRGRLERVEVHAHEVDELDLVLLRRDHVRRVVAQREQARVELRVQRLDAPAHDLREAREVLDRADLEPGLAQRRGGAAGGDQLDAELGQARARSRRSPSCPTPTAARGGSRTSPGCVIASIGADDTSATRSATRRGLAGSSRTASRAISAHRLAQQLVLDRAQRRRGPRRRRSPPAARPRAGG